VNGQPVEPSALPDAASGPGGWTQPRAARADAHRFAYGAPPRIRAPAV